MKPPSVLEWVIIGCMAAIVIIYCIVSIYKMVDRKKHPEKYKNKKQKEREELDE